MAPSSATNVALHEVAVEVESGNAAEALRLAGRIDASVLSPERQARFSRRCRPCADQRRAVTPAVAALTEAEQIAFGEVSDSRRVRELLDDLEHLAKGWRIGLRPRRLRRRHPQIDAIQLRVAVLP